MKQFATLAVLLPLLLLPAAYSFGILWEGEIRLGAGAAR